MCTEASNFSALKVRVTEKQVNCLQAQGIHPQIPVSEFLYLTRNLWNEFLSKKSFPKNTIRSGIDMDMHACI